MSQPTTDLYYDGAYDALTEVIQEIKAAWVIGIRDIKREHYRSDIQFFEALMERAVTDLQASYEKDRTFVHDFHKKREGQDA